MLPTLLPGRHVIEIYRKPHNFDLYSFQLKGDWHTKIPPGFHFQTIDQLTTPKIGVLSSWSSIDEFLTNGIGLLLLKDEEIACTCISVFSSSEKVEMDVHTDEKFRRQGLADMICSAFIEKCIQLGKLPNWECFWDNQPSLNLAKKLGFIAQDEYPVFYWEELIP